MQILSSKYTFFYKYILLLIWIIGVGVGAREILFFPPEYDLRWMQYAAIWSAIAIFIFFATGSIKKVTIDRKKKVLVVSNFLKTHTISIDDIEDIDGSSLLSPKLVWFMLKVPSAFGSKIEFLPVTRPQGSIGKHPMVIELRTEFALDK